MLTSSVLEIGVNDLLNEEIVDLSVLFYIGNGKENWFSQSICGFWFCVCVMYLFLGVLSNFNFIYSANDTVTIDFGLEGMN